MLWKWSTTTYSHHLWKLNRRTVPCCGHKLLMSVLNIFFPSCFCVPELTKEAVFKLLFKKLISSTEIWKMTGGFPILSRFTFSMSITSMNLPQTAMYNSTETAPCFLGLHCSLWCCLASPVLFSAGFANTWVINHSVSFQQLQKYRFIHLCKMTPLDQVYNITFKVGAAVF